jgi:primosomal protein N' (replication factor Y)
MTEKRALPVAEVLILRRAKMLAEPFDYLIPPLFVEECRPGKIVRVPLGRSEAVGVVIRTKQRSRFENLKNIIEVLSSAPSLKDYQIDLLSWLSSYYVESPGSVISLFLPAGFSASLEKHVALLTSEVSPELYQFLVGNGGSAPYRAVESYLGRAKAAHLLREALKNEAVRIYWVLKKKGVKPKVTYEIFLAGSEEFELVLRRTRSKRLKAFLKELESRGFLTLEEASSDFSVSLSELKKLEGIGAIRLVERYVSRLDTATVETYDREVELNEHQKRALEEIEKSIERNEGKEFLLYGPTGSGKTEVYLRAARHARRLGYGVIYLVPEISLTPQTYSRVERVFGAETAVFHSGLKASERMDEWVQVEQGLKKVVVGARSALFVPMSNPGLIIIDEEHDSSYRQDSSPIYDARRVARKLAELTGCTVIYGSATPSIERYYEAKTGRIKLLKLPERVSGRRPEVEVIDLRKEKSLFSTRLKEELKNTVESGEKAIIFLNRRGYAVVEVCDSCGYLATCPRCSVYLRYHQDIKKLLCHYCGYSKPPDSACPSCSDNRIRLKGRGIQKVEAEIRDLFEDRVKVLRVDSDVAREGKVRNRLFDFYSKEPSVLVGTQMIAKGLHLPQITLVGIINADVGLQLPDFRAEERTFQLIVQVMGRAGRGEKGGKVLIQTWQPERSVINYAAREDLEGFYDYELKLREANGLPPFKHIVRILVSSREEQSAVITASEIEKRIRNELIGSIEIHGPFPAPLYLLNRRYRIQIILKSDNEPAFEILGKIRKAASLKVKDVRVSIEVDPETII